MTTFALMNIRAVLLSFFFIALLFIPTVYSFSNSLTAMISVSQQIEEENHNHISIDIVDELYYDTNRFADIGSLRSEKLHYQYLAHYENIVQETLFPPPEHSLI
ncbi:MAG: hypothetical protein M0R38_00795 [Bacteroidia bacterium]|nr:hypothetical protein [Bacteroidia bacterium]